MDQDLDWLGFGGVGAAALFPSSAAGFLEDDDLQHRNSDTLGSSTTATCSAYTDTAAAASYGAGSGFGADTLAPSSSSAMVATTVTSATVVAAGPAPSMGASMGTSSSTIITRITSEQLQPFEDTILDYMFRRATERFDPFTPRGIHWPAGVTERRQFLRTHFASLARHLVYVGPDPATHRFLDYQRSERFETFLRGTLLALGPTPTPEAMLQHVAAHAPEEISGLLVRSVPADEFLLVNPGTLRPRVFAVRMRKCSCLADKLAAGVDLLAEGLGGLDATLDDLYDGLERHLLLNPSSLVMPRGVEPLLVIRYNALPTAELLLARVPGSPRPYRWRASLSPGTMGIAQHLFDPSREGVGTRLRDLGVFLQSTEVHACLWDGQTHGPAKHLVHSSSHEFVLERGRLPVLGPKILSLPVSQPLEALAQAAQQKVGAAELQHQRLPQQPSSLLSTLDGTITSSFSHVGMVGQLLRTNPSPCPFLSADKATGSMVRSLSSEALEEALRQQQQEEGPTAAVEGASKRRARKRGSSSGGSGSKKAKRKAAPADSASPRGSEGREGGGQPDAAGGPGPRCTVCGAPARFKLAGGNKFVDGFCGEHAEATMVDIRGPVCDFPDCTRPNAPVAKRATYALPGESKPRRCSKHREDGMVDVVHKAASGNGGEAGPQQPPAKRGRGARGGGRKKEGQPDLAQGVSASTTESLLSSSSSASSSASGSASPKEGEKEQGSPTSSTSLHKAKSSSLGSTASLLAATLSMGEPGFFGCEDDGAMPPQGQAAGTDDEMASVKAARCEELRRMAQHLAATADSSEAPPPARAMSTLAVVQLLREPDQETRQLALEVLARLGAPAAQAIVSAGLLVDGCADVRRWAVCTLGQLGPHAAACVNVVAPFLHDADPEARQWAAFALGQMGGAAARAALVSALDWLLRDLEAEVRCATLKALGRLEAAGADAAAAGASAGECLAGTVAPCIHDPEPKVQLAAVAVLAGYGERAAPYAEMLTLLLGSPVWQLAHAAEEALPRMGPGVGEQMVRLGLLTDARKEVRGAALRVLGELGAGAWPHCEAIRARLADPDESVRLSATNALARLVQTLPLAGEGNGNAAAAAERCLEDLARLLLADGSLEVRARALNGFIGIGPRAAPYVGAVARMLLEDAEPFARSVALDTLCCLGELALPYMDRVVAVLRLDSERLVVSRSVYHLSTGVFRDRLPEFARAIAGALVEALRDDRIDQSQLGMANSLLAFCMDHLPATEKEGVQAGHLPLPDMIPSSEALGLGLGLG